MQCRPVDGVLSGRVVRVGSHVGGETNCSVKSGTRISAKRAAVK